MKQSGARAVNADEMTRSDALSIQMQGAGTVEKALF